MESIQARVIVLETMSQVQTRVHMWCCRRWRQPFHTGIELEFKTFEYPGKESTRGLNGACEDRGLNAEEAEEYSPGSESPGYESAAGLGSAYGYEAAAAAR